MPLTILLMFCLGKTTKQISVWIKPFIYYFFPSLTVERNNLLFISLSTTCTARSLQGEDETKNKPPMTDVAHILSCTMGRCSDSGMVKAACKNIESGNYNGVLRKGYSLCKNILPLTNHPGITCIKVGKPPGHNSACYTSLPDCVLSLFYT